MARTTHGGGAIRSGGRRLAAVGIVALMAVGSLVMWIANPVGWLYVASRLEQDSTQPRLWLFVVVIIGIVVTMAGVGKLLVALNRLYARVTRSEATVRVPTAWMRSIRGERDSTRPRTVLDVVMITSVGLAVLSITVWFFAFAGSPLPH